MDQEQRNITTMAQTVVKFLDEKNSVWSGIPAWVDAVTRAKTGITAIVAKAGEQETPLKGITQDKGSLRADLEEKTLEIADQVAAFAAKNGDHDLLAKVTVTKSSLDIAPDAVLLEIAQRAHDLANANIAALAAYNVTAADVTALDAARQAFANLKDKPREKTSERSAQTKSVAELIAGVRSIFRNELDKMATKFRKSNPEFFNGYFAARVIVDVAATHKVPKKPGTP